LYKFLLATKYNLVLVLVLCGKSPEEGKEKAYKNHESQRTRDFNF